MNANEMRKKTQIAIDQLEAEAKLADEKSYANVMAVITLAARRGEFSTYYQEHLNGNVRMTLESEGYLVSDISKDSKCNDWLIDWRD